MSRDNRKICPIMSGVVPRVRPKQAIGTGEPLEHGAFQEVLCKKWACQLYVEVYTTEVQRMNGSAFELQPSMIDGQFRV